MTPGVLWREGMLLSPQHFQQAERAETARAAAVLRLASPMAVGLARLRIDPAALAAGSFALTAVEALLPDGTPVQADDPAALPAAVDLAARFPAAATRAVIHLALPLAAPGAVAVAMAGVHAGRQVRLRSAAGEVVDTVDGGTRAIELAEPNLRLVVDGESLDGLSALPLAAVVREAADRFALDPAFAPPSLRLDAAPALLSQVRAVVALASARAAEIAAHRRSRVQGLIEFAVGDVAAVMTLLAIGGALPGLRQACDAGWPHPAGVHERLAALAGQLVALSGDGDPGDLPAYDHRHPAVALTALAERLGSLLRTVTASRYLALPAQPAGERVHAAQVPEQVGTGSRFFLGVISTLPAERVIRELPARGKVASHGRLDTLVASALPGIRLVYQSAPPPEVPVQPGGAYFLLDPNGGEWDQAMRTRTLAVYLPPELAQARVEFMAIRDA